MPYRPHLLRKFEALTDDCQLRLLELIDLTWQNPANRRAPSQHLHIVPPSPAADRPHYTRFVETIGTKPRPMLKVDRRLVGDRRRRPGS